MIKSKVSALFSLILVFVSGAFFGGFAYRLYSVPSVQTTPGGGAQPTPRPSPEEVKRKIIADMTKAVKLDATQANQINEIMERAHQEFDQLRDKSKPEWDDLNRKRDALVEKYRPDQEGIRARQIQQITDTLREDQRPLYKAWREERERQRKLRDQHKK